MNYISCDYLEASVVQQLDTDTYETCSVLPGLRGIELAKVKDDTNFSFDEISSRRKDIIRNNTMGLHSKCINCGMLKIYNGDKIGNNDITHYSIISCLDNGKHNEQTSRLIVPITNKLLKTSNIHLQSLDLHIGVEALLLKDLIKAIRIISPKLLSLKLITSLSIWNEELAVFLASNNDKFNSSILLSLDCGTSQTYCKIKGEDLFDKVIDNVSKYINSGVDVNLQYLVSNDNADISEAKSFCSILSKMQIKHVTLDIDRSLIENSSSLYTDKHIKVGQYIHSYCVANGISVIYGNNCISINSGSEWRHKVISD